MSEMSFEQMLDETFKTIHNGEVLEGKVISVRPDEAVLNIGYKADGILTSNEYSNTPVDLTTVISATINCFLSPIILLFLGLNSVTTNSIS